MTKFIVEVTEYHTPKMREYIDRVKVTEIFMHEFADDGITIEDIEEIKGNEPACSGMPLEPDPDTILGIVQVVGKTYNPHTGHWERRP